MSKIEWTEKTWNPIVGCSIVSKGCTNCYAMRQAARLLDKPGTHYDGTTKSVKGNPVWTGKVARAPEHILLEPLRRKKPTMFFVNSMGDLFHEDVPDEWIDRVFAIMALTPQHTYQVLTKRSARMREYMAARSMPDERGNSAEDIRIAMTVLAGTPSRREATPALKSIPLGKYCAKIVWPLPNVWLGVSTEDQASADERIPDLLATPAAVRFISAEPLLGAVKVSGYLWGRPQSSLCDDCPRTCDCECNAAMRSTLGHPTIDWVIVGGESGKGARAMHPDWARSLRDQCAAASVAFFFKQMTKKTEIPDDLLVREFPDAR